MSLRIKSTLPKGWLGYSALPRQVREELDALRPSISRSWIAKLPDEKFAGTCTLNVLKSMMRSNLALDRMCAARKRGRLTISTSDRMDSRGNYLIRRITESFTEFYKFVSSFFHAFDGSLYSLDEHYPVWKIVKRANVLRAWAADQGYKFALQLLWREGHRYELLVSMVGQGITVVGSNGSILQQMMMRAKLDITDSLPCGIMVDRSADGELDWSRMMLHWSTQPGSSPEYWAGSSIYALRYMLGRRTRPISKELIERDLAAFFRSARRGMLADFNNPQYFWLGDYQTLAEEAEARAESASTT